MARFRYGGCSRQLTSSSKAVGGILGCISDGDGDRGNCQIMHHRDEGMKTGSLAIVFRAEKSHRRAQRHMVGLYQRLRHQPAGG